MMDDVLELVWSRHALRGCRGPCDDCMLFAMLAAEVRELRTNKRYWERVANCLLSTCTDDQANAAIGAAIEQGAIDAALSSRGEDA